jgi:ATP synthase I chain
MIRNSVSVRVAVETCALGGLVAVAAAWLGGAGAAFGVVAGSALAVLNFLWLARGVTRASADTSRVAWVLASSLRMVAVAGVFAALLATGVIHPVALVIGLTALPCALVARGLSTARKA